MWPGFPWTDGEACALGQRERKEKVFHHLGDHLTAGLGLLKPQPAPGAGGKEGCPTAGGPRNLPAWPCSTVDLPHEPGDRFPWLLSAASLSRVGGQQRSYLCSTPKMGRCCDVGALGKPWGSRDLLSVERSPSVTC